MHMKHTETQTHEHTGTRTFWETLFRYTREFPRYLGRSFPKTLGTFPKLGANFLTNTRNVPNYLFFEWGSRPLSEAGPKSTWTTNSIFFGRPIFWWSSPKHEHFPNFCRWGTLWRHSEKQSPTTFGIGNVPDWTKFPKNTRTFPNFFSGSPWGISAVPKNTRERSRIFFSGASDFRKILGSSPQKHSGTFPNFFRGGWLQGKSSKTVTGSQSSDWSQSRVEQGYYM